MATRHFPEFRNRNMKHTVATKAGGFTLIELMVSMVIGLIVIGAVMALVLSMVRSNKETIAATRLTQELRATSALITSELQRAGSSGNPFDITSTLALGTVTTIQTMPILLLSLFGGVLADRLPKRRLLVVTQSIMLTQALVLAVLVSTGLVQLLHIYLLAAVLGTVNAIDNPSRQAFVKDLVGADDLPNAVALNSTQFNMARLVGPALGGLMIAGLDTEGRPGLAWRARRAAKDARREAKHLAASARREAKLAAAQIS